MPRKPRLHYSGAMYHVITRGNNRQKIFLTEENYKTFLEYLKQIKEKKPFNLYAYCLMPNHIHLLIEVKNEPLSEIMHRLLTGYTKHFNLTNKKWGHLFQGRYKAILCEKDSYLMELARYIHLNPVRAKMVKKPSEYRWSGHKNYLNISKDTLIDEDELLKYFSLDKAEARKLYEHFVRDGADMGHRKDMYPQEKVPYLGQDKYIEEHIIMHQEILTRQTPGAVKLKITLNADSGESCHPFRLKPAT
jgi:REP element-mobilizing transposase RayT